MGRYVRHTLNVAHLPHWKEEAVRLAGGRMTVVIRCCFVPIGFSQMDGAATPLVSVLTITYNHENYIRQAVESVLAQETQFPCELVIGEDRSTDDTWRIVSEYRDQHPDVIRAFRS